MPDGFLFCLVFFPGATTLPPELMLLSPTSEKPGSFSGLGIVLSNLFAIVLALWQDWDLRPMLAIYWAQSVIIGIFNFCRILKLRDFSTEGFTSNGKRVPETPKGKRSTAFFFALHYGLFHFGYLVFLLVIFSGGDRDFGYESSWDGGEAEGFWIGSAVLGFLVGHWFSFRQNVAADLRGRPNIGTMMFLPYARIIPMHLTIIFGSMLATNRIAVLLFSVLKTGADYLMHVVEHKVLQKGK